MTRCWASQTYGHYLTTGECVEAVEDAYVLCSLLGDESGPITRRRARALEARVAIRRPQAQKVIKTSRKLARSMRLRARQVVSLERSDLTC